MIWHIVSEGALPQKSIADASHIAAASVNTLDMIISLNFRHIVKERTIEMTGAINTLLGYKPMKIKTPMEVIDDEKPDTILDEIHATRRKLNEATKDMTSSERTAYYNQAGEAAAKKKRLYTYCQRKGK